MTRRSIREYAAAVRGRYLRASKSEKGRILDEFCQVTGYHRKSATRLLRHPPQGLRKRRGRPKEYQADLVEALKIAWEATDHVCSKRLVPFLPALVSNLERHKELGLTERVRSQLLTVSVSTVDRLLAPFRQRGGRRPSTTRSTSALQRLIPIRTFADQKRDRVGYLQVDLVAHCGASAEGFYLHTLLAVDVLSGWTECVPVWGKGQSRVGGAVDRVCRQVPFKVLGIQSDNGSEFINHALWDYCHRHGIEFTRSRSYKKNDQAHVEQKNWSAVRRLVGYDRYATQAAYRQLEQLYTLVRLHMNFFQPMCKLVRRERVGTKVRKHYDRAQTAYQRLVATNALGAAQGEALARLYEYLNPVQLRSQMEEALQTLWQMAHPDPRTKAEAAALAKLEAQPPASLPRAVANRDCLGNTFI